MTVNITSCALTTKNVWGGEEGHVVGIALSMDITNTSDKDGQWWFRFAGRNADGDFVGTDYVGTTIFDMPGGSSDTAPGYVDLSDFDPDTVVGRVIADSGVVSPSSEWIGDDLPYW